MDFNKLLEKLENNLHNTCKKYQLYFKNISGIWTIQSYSYNDENKCILLELNNKPIQNKRDIKELQDKLIKEYKILQENDNLYEKLYDKIDNNKENVIIGIIIVSTGISICYLYNCYKNYRFENLTKELINNLEEKHILQTNHYETMVKYGISNKLDLSNELDELELKIDNINNKINIIKKKLKT